MGAHWAAMSYMDTGRCEVMKTNEARSHAARHVIEMLPLRFDSDMVGYMLAASTSESSGRNLVPRSNWFPRALKAEILGVPGGWDQF